MNEKIKLWDEGREETRVDHHECEPFITSGWTALLFRFLVKMWVDQFYLAFSVFVLKEPQAVWSQQLPVCPDRMKHKVVLPGNQHASPNVIPWTEKLVRACSHVIYFLFSLIRTSETLNEAIFFSMCFKICMRSRGPFKVAHWWCHT